MAPWRETRLQRERLDDSRSGSKEWWQGMERTKDKGGERRQNRERGEWRELEAINYNSTKKEQLDSVPRAYYGPNLLISGVLSYKFIWNIPEIRRGAPAPSAPVVPMHLYSDVKTTLTELRSHYWIVRRRSLSDRSWASVLFARDLREGHIVLPTPLHCHSFGSKKHHHFPILGSTLLDHSTSREPLTRLARFGSPCSPVAWHELFILTWSRSSPPNHSLGAWSGSPLVEGFLPR